MKYINIEDFVKFIDQEKKDYFLNKLEEYKIFHKKEKFKKHQKKREPHFLYNLYLKKNVYKKNLKMVDLLKILKEEFYFDWVYNDVYLASIRFENNKNNYIREKNLKKYNNIEIERVRNSLGK